MLVSHLVLGFWMVVPILWSRRNAAVVSVGALLVASCAAWGVVIAMADDAEGTAFVSGFALAAANVLVGLAAGAVLFGAFRAIGAGAAAISRR